MRLTIAHSQQNLVLINNDTHQRETLSERPIRPPLNSSYVNYIMKVNDIFVCNGIVYSWGNEH